MTNLGVGPCCPDCGAQLRRGRRSGQQCDPCQRRGPRIILPEGFYDQPSLETALAGFDFGIVFRAIRDAQHWSQQTLAEFLDLEQARLSRIETGKRQLLDLGVVVRVANRLVIPAGKLGFTHGVTVSGGMSTGRKGSWVERRDFVQHVAILTLAGTGATELDLDRLTALLPHAEPTGTRHVGAADVEAVEQATAAFRRQDNTQGSELFQAVAVTQLHSVFPLLDAQATSEVRSRLLVATAELATEVGYMSLDVTQHDAARRLWTIALDITRNTEDPRGTDLTVFVLYDMALQALHLGRPGEALRLVHLGHAAAAGSHPVSASTSCCLANIQAKAHAAQGDAVACDRALGQAVDHFAAIDPASHERWATLTDEAGLAAYQGHVYYTLALVDRDPRTAGRAVPLLRHAVDHFRPDCARARAYYLADLVGAHAIAGDADTAVMLGHQAVDAITVLHSPRAYDRLRVLDTALQPLRTSPGVAELRARLTIPAA